MRGYSAGVQDGKKKKKTKQPENQLKVFRASFQIVWTSLNFLLLFCFLNRGFIEAGLHQKQKPLLRSAVSEREAGPTAAQVADRRGASCVLSLPAPGVCAQR